MSEGEAKAAKPVSMVELRKLARRANETTFAPVKEYTRHPSGSKRFNIGHFFVRRLMGYPQFLRIYTNDGQAVPVFKPCAPELLEIQMQAFVQGAGVCHRNFTARF